MTRRCKLTVCRAEIPVQSKCSDPYQKRGFCNVNCMAGHGMVKAKQAREKATRAKTKAQKEALKTRPQHYKDLQAAVNAYVKHALRKGEPCYTCGKEQRPSDTPQAFHVGHFMPAKTVDPRRFTLENLRIQCFSCNSANSGRQAEYRKRLQAEMGADFVDWLECEANHKPLKEQYPEIQHIKEATAMYRKLLRDHQKNQ